MSAITGENPNQPMFSFPNLANLLKVPASTPPASEEPLYPALSSSPISAPIPPCNPDFNPDLPTQEFDPSRFLPPLINLQVISLPPKEQILVSQPVEVPEAYRYPKAKILSTELCKKIDGLQEIHFKDYDPWEYDDSSHVHLLISLMHKETTGKFPIFEKQDPNKEVSEEAYLQRLRVCEQAIYEIEQLPHLDPNLKRLIEVGFRRTMVIDLVNNETIFVMNQFEEGKGIPAYIQTLSHDLFRFETRGNQYPRQNPQENILSTLLHGVCFRVNESLKDRAQEELLKLPLEQQLQKCRDLINFELESFLPNNDVYCAIARSTFETSSYSFGADDNFTQFLTRHYVKRCKDGLEQGTLTPQDFNAMLKVLADLNPYQNPLLPFIEKILGTLEIDKLKAKIEQEAADQKISIEFNNKARTSVGHFFRQYAFWKDSAPKQQIAKLDAIQSCKCRFLDHVDTLIDGLKPAEELLSDFHMISSTPSMPAIAPTAVQLKEVVPPPISPLPETVLSPLSLREPLVEQPPVVQAAPKNYLEDIARFQKPLVSYVHIAFPDVLEQISRDQNPYKLFTKLVQKDLLRHLIYTRAMGPVENRIEETFKKRVDGIKIRNVGMIYRKKLDRLQAQPDMIAATDDANPGEKILNLYYTSGKYQENLHAFSPTAQFLRHFLAQAQAAEVRNVPQHEDLDWAGNNYKNRKFIHLTIHALERYLHA